ncbi:hypothetical protein AB2063_002974 [Clostridium botulinum]|uniref:hypothetical protein n=1 Tax=Clostridium sporogenes TaxID=1509 RepID=UPI003592297F
MEQTIIDLCSEITEIGMKISLFTEHDVFINFSGHVEWFEVRFCGNGHNSSSGQEFSEVVRVGCDAWEDSPEYVLKRLRGIRDTLRKLYKNGKVNKQNFDYETEVIKHYKFK